MHYMKLAAWALVGTAALTGCGGGGGGGGSPAAAPVASTPGPGAAAPAPANGNWLTLTPGAVALTGYPGESVRFEVRAVSSRTFDKPFNVGIIDDKGVVSPQIAVSKQSDLDYIVSFRTAVLAAGTHATTLQVRLCEDDPLVCSKPLPGSPWSLPVTVNVAGPAETQQRFSFTPSPVDVVVYEGEPRTFVLDIKANSTFDVPIALAVADSAGVIAPEVVISQSARNQYGARLTTAATLAQGVHDTTLEVRACYDNARECKSPVSGSPWRVPAKVTVKPGANIAELSRIPGLAPWSTYNGNAGFTGYVRGSFNPVAFTRRWSMPAAAPSPVSAPAIANGKLFAVRGNVFSKNWELVAIDEANGQVLWRHDFSNQYQVNPPAAVDGRVVVSARGILDARLWVFDQATGQLVSTTPIAAQSDCRLAPAVVGDMVYAETGSNGGIVGFNASASRIAWTNASLPKYDACSPSVEGQFAYAYVLNQVHAISTADGSAAFTITQADGATQGQKSQPLVVGDGMAYVTDGSRLIGFDLQTRTRAWVAAVSPSLQPVLGNNHVFSLGENGTVVEARLPRTGDLKWKSGMLTNWSLGTPYEQLLVTADLLFVSGPNVTIALDLATHQVVWSYPLGGKLAISDRGVLYIADASGRLDAVNLR